MVEFLRRFPQSDSSDSPCRLRLFAKEVQLFDVVEIADLVLSPDDFVMGTFDTNLGGWLVMKRRVHGLPFGNVIRD